MKQKLLFLLTLLAITFVAIRANAQDYTYTPQNNAATITGYTGSSSIINIPRTIQGLAVTSIGDYAFNGNSRLTNLTIPNSVISIGSAAFHGCASLASLTIPESVTTIENSVFQDCSALRRLNFAGDAPVLVSSFAENLSVVIYFLPGRSGWGNSFGGRPTAEWHLPHPVILTGRGGPSQAGGDFRFTVSWATNASVVVEAAADAGQAVWTPIKTNLLTDGVFQFSDPAGRSVANRFYRAVLLP